METNSNDSKPKAVYIIFRCEKCKRYLYAKQTQKATKCMICHHSNKIAENIQSLRGQGAIFGKTLTEAAKEVQRLQTLYSQTKTTEFTSSKKSLAFRPATEMENHSQIQVNNGNSNKDPNLDTFSARLAKWQITERIDRKIGFPPYMLDLIGSEIGLNGNQIIKCIQSLKQSNKLVRYPSGNYYLKI